MRTLILLLFLSLTSCTSLIPSFSSPSYHLKENEFSQWVDFRKGNWVLYYVSVPVRAEADIKERTEKDFNSVLKNDLVISGKNSELLENNLTEFTPDIMREIHEKSGMDFLVLIHSQQGIEGSFRNWERNYDIFGPVKEPYVKEDTYRNEVFTTLRILDLKEKKTVYNKIVTAKTYNKNKKTIDIRPDPNKVILKSYKKLFKDLKKNSFH